MKLVKYITIIFYTTLLALSILIFPLKESAAKYIKNDSNALNYGVKFKNLASSYTKSEILPTSNAEELNYGVSFKRNNNMENNDTLDSYLINLNNSYCKVKNVYIDNVLTPVTDNTINFTSPGEENVDINISCNLSKMVEEDKLDLSINTYGYFNDNKDFSYLFATDSYELSDLEAYYNEYGWPNQDYCSSGSRVCRLLKSNDENDIYTRLVEWIGTSTKINDDKKGLINYYLMSSLSNKENKVTEENIPNFNSLDGINASFNDKYYIFEVDSYFGGYAVTYYNYQSKPSNTPIDLYFYSEDDIDALFIKYIQKYLNPSDIVVVENYLKTKEQYYSVENIFDLIKVDSRLKSIIIHDDVEKTLTVPVNLYSIVAGEKLSYSILKSTNSTGRIRLLRRYLNSYIDPALTEKILYENGSYSYIANSIIKNDTVFDNYTYIVNENDTLLLHVYSKDDTQIFFEEEYIDSNTINLEYDSSNSNSNIKSDLNSISKNIKGTDLVLTDNNGNTIDINDESLLEGDYTSNIGTIKVSSNDSKKYITITF